MVSLAAEIGGLEFEPPIILASGILGQTAPSLKRVMEMGIGGVVTKSIGREPREGHPNPTMLELETGLLNAMGLPNPGIEAFEDELEELFSYGSDIPVIGSIFSETTEGFVELASIMEEEGVQGVELNLSCPHAEGVGASIGSDRGLTKKVVSDVAESVDIPVFVKLPPIHDISDLALVSQKAGADAVVAINTVKAMAINLETRRPVLGNEVGGYSGPGIKPIGLRCVYEVYKETDIPVIGCGGINSGKDALEYILAGASLVQIGSALHYRGIEAPRSITQEMSELLNKENTADIEELVGRAFERC